MSYRKQRTAIKSGEPCDPVQVNENIHPIAQELSGRVTDHNIVAGTFPASRVSDACYYAFGSGAGTPYYVSVAADLGVYPLGLPLAGANSWRVPDTSEWTTVDRMTVSPVTGQSVLWVIAQLQYAVVVPFPVPEDLDAVDTIALGIALAAVSTAILTGVGLGPAMAALSLFLSTKPGVHGAWERDGAHPNLQFAIRVDGVIADDTITGLEEPQNPAPRGHLPETPCQLPFGGQYPFSIHTFTTNNCEGMGFPVCPVRMITMVPVDEGTHTVEVVVRRFPPQPTPRGSHHIALNPDAEWEDFQAVKSGQTIVPVYPAYIFNRKLLAVDMHLQAPSTGSTFSVQLATPLEGDTVNAAAMHTNSVAAIVTQENSLGDGAMARNALRHDHLPGRTLYPNQVGFTTGLHFQGAYPGFATVGVAAGWHIITDNAAAPLIANNNGTGNFDFAANPGFVIALANVAVSNVRPVPNTDQEVSMDMQYAWFTIQGLYAGGVEFQSAAGAGNGSGVAGSAEMCINNPNRLSILGGAMPAGMDRLDPIETDVPLFEYFDYRNAPPTGGAIVNFRVLGGNSWSYGAGTCEVSWRKSNLAVLGIKK